MSAERLVIKYAYRIPELVTRALAGDPIAIGLLAAMGISAAAYAMKKDK